MPVHGEQQNVAIHFSEFDPQWRSLTGDPTEGALLALAMKAGVTAQSVLSRYPRTAEIPFDSSHKYMATFHRVGDGIVLFVKGAPDVLLPRCTRIANCDGESPLDDAG